MMEPSLFPVVDVGTRGSLTRLAVCPAASVLRTSPPWRPVDWTEGLFARQRPRRRSQTDVRSTVDERARRRRTTAQSTHLHSTCHCRPRWLHADVSQQVPASDSDDRQTDEWTSCPSRPPLPPSTTCVHPQQSTASTM